MTEKNSVTVLLVDDEPGILTALEFLVQKAGYHALTAANGEQAIELALAHRPQVVVLDVMMPGMDGFQTARNLRANPALEDCRIVFLTAKGAAKDRFEGYDSGAEIYLTKPFDNEELMHTIEELIQFG